MTEAETEEKVDAGKTAETKAVPGVNDVPGWDSLPGYRKRDAVVLLFLVFIPAALVIIWTGPVFVRTETGYRTTTPAWNLVASVLGIVAMLAVYSWQRDQAIEAATIPLCDSSAAAEAAQNAIIQSPVGRTQGFRLLAIRRAEERSWDPDTQTRICAIEGLTNAGVKDGVMTLSWLDRGRATFYVSVNFF